MNVLRRVWSGSDFSIINLGIDQSYLINNRIESDHFVSYSN